MNDQQPTAGTKRPRDIAAIPELLGGYLNQRREGHLESYLAGSATRLGPAPADASVVVVAVHGRSLSPAHMVEHLVSRLGDDRDDIAWILPVATEHTWYPVGFLAPFADNQPALDDALATMATIAEELVDVDSRRVVWVGYSQGACLVAEHLARHPQRWGAAAILTGGMIGPAEHPLSVSGPLHDMPTYFSNGDADDRVPLWRTQATADAFRAAGANTTVDVFPGRAHEIGDAEISRVRALLDGIAR